MYKVILWVMSCYVIGSQSAAAVDINPCKFGDDECLLKSAQAVIPFLSAGIPSLGISSMDPLIIDEINADNGELKLQFKDVSITRLGQCKFISVSLPDKTNLELVIECPFVVVGKYTLGGKLTAVPVQGEGDFEFKTEKIQLDVKAQMKVDNGNKVVVESYDYTYDPVEKIYFKFENLFNGDQQKAKPVLDLLDASWKQLTIDVGKPVINEVVDRIKNNIVTFISAMTASELYKS